ncbi:hypothetical protein BKA69DRAFT_591366 [Paraphysoderma sedebokerense]|nr:hypothetical protein BKA69DRAFT_591366 [Paraphysoderma sedebokerense]
MGPQSNTTESITISYEPPSMFRIVPNNGPTNGGNLIRINGKNFGPCSNPPCPLDQSSIHIGDQLCEQWRARTARHHCSIHTAVRLLRQYTLNFLSLKHRLLRSRDRTLED